MLLKQKRDRCEILKFIALIDSIVIDFEGLHESFSPNRCDSVDANHGTQFTQSGINNSVTACAKQMQNLFFEFSNRPVSSVLWQEKVIQEVQ
jgi:hypothetical protein